MQTPYKEEREHRLRARDIKHCPRKREDISRAGGRERRLCARECPSIREKKRWMTARESENVTREDSIECQSHTRHIESQPHVIDMCTIHAAMHLLI